MIFRLFTIIFLIFTWSTPFAATNDVLHPKTRTINISGITEAIIDVLPGRAVKFIFPWVLDDDGGELPFLVTMSNDAYFNQPIVKPGHNVMVMTYKKIDRDMDGEITDLLVSSRGYHFSFTLKANFKPSDHYSTVVLKISERDKLLLIDKEIAKVNEILLKERAKIESEVDERAKVHALALVGGLSTDDPDTTAVKEESVLKLKNGDQIVGYVDGYDNFGSFVNFRFELENDSNKATYIQSVRLAKIDASGTKTFFPSSYLVDPKLASGKTIKGTLSMIDFEPEDGFDNALIISTDQGSVEITF